MYKRITGLFRDAWYLVIVVVVSSVALWIFLAPLVGAAVILFGLITFVYFGLVRYDNEGNERTGSRS